MLSLRAVVQLVQRDPELVHSAFGDQGHTLSQWIRRLDSGPLIHHSLNDFSELVLVSIVLVQPIPHIGSLNDLTQDMN